MNVMQFVRALMITAATFGVACPQVARAGQEPSVPTKEAINGGTVTVTPDGLLVGALIDASGHGVGEAAVAVVKDGKLLLNSKTDKAGKFQARGVTPGKILVVTNQTLHKFQAVDSTTADPDAKKGIIIPVDPEIARGAFNKWSAGLIGTLLVAGVVAAIIIATDDDDDDAS